MWFKLGVNRFESRKFENDPLRKTLYIIRPSSVNRCRTIHGDWYHHYVVKSVSERGEIRRSKNYKITKKSKTTLLNTDKSQHRLCKRPCLKNNALLRNPIDIFVCLCSSGDKSNSWKAHLLYGWCVSYSYGERDCLSAGGYEGKTKRSTLTITTLTKQWIYYFCADVYKVIVK